ncbi:IPT/TIG domain-containing protein, partial [Pedobacter sp.]|nr:IPT/TIG domain-containing protein [Candidatus Saccharibacteria bacterium]
MSKLQLIWLGSWLVLALFLALAITIIQLRAAGSVIWVGTTSTDWNTPANWSTGIVPVATDDVIINSGTNQPTLNLTAGTVTINSLVLGNSTATMTLTVANGAPTTNELHTLADLTVAAKGIVTHSANTTTQTHRLALKVDGRAMIATGGKIDVTAKGFAAVNGPGKGTSAALTNGGSGAGYGAAGGLGKTITVAGVSYGSPTLPVDLGSGGGSGASGVGGAGGGVIYLTSSNQIDVNGSLLADGAVGTATYGGGGSGGSIYVSAPKVLGGGAITANGGNGSTTNGGGGSGGRVAVDRPTLALAVDSVSPTSGGANGGQTVTVTGQGFSASAQVQFRTTDTHGQTHAVVGTTTYVDSTTVTAIAPPSAYYGTVEVIVVNQDLFGARTMTGGTGYQVGGTGSLSPEFGAGNSMATLAGAYSYYPPPTLTSSLPISALKIGGDTITVTGTNFQSGAVVNFSRQPATTTFVNATTLTAVVPAGIVGTVNISVVNPDGLLSTLFSAFTYTEVAPTITSMTPASGRMPGGQIVTLTGADFVQGVTDVTQISSGNSHSCGIINGGAYCWGLGTSGQLGNSAILQSNTPVKVTQTAGLLLGKTVTAISAGTNFSCAIASGEVYCWGLGTSGQLGNSTTVTTNAPVKVTQTSGLLLGKTVTDISVGNIHTCVIADGEAYCWGSNGNGPLGDATVSQRNAPVKVTQTAGLLLGKTVTDIAAGGAHSCAITGGEAYCWGLGTSGQLGNDSIVQSNVPTKVTQTAGFLASKVITAITTGNLHTCAVADGEAFCWGTNGNGQLGNNSLVQSTAPVRSAQDVGVLAGKVAGDISAGTNHTCATADGQAFCWGYNGYGQLGNNSTTQSLIPVKVTQSIGLLSLKSAGIISAGGNHSCVIADGDLTCFGQNTTGQLGNNTTTTSNVPVAVVTPLRGALPTISIGGNQTSLVQILSST